jgi:hypothetical protein
MVLKGPFFSAALPHAPGDPPPGPHTYEICVYSPLLQPGHMHMLHVHVQCMLLSM